MVEENLLFDINFFHQILQSSFILRMEQWTLVPSPNLKYYWAAFIVIFCSVLSYTYLWGFWSLLFVQILSVYLESPSVVIEPIYKMKVVIFLDHEYSYGWVEVEEFQDNLKNWLGNHTWLSASYSLIELVKKSYLLSNLFFSEWNKSAWISHRRNCNLPFDTSFHDIMFFSFFLYGILQVEHMLSDRLMQFISVDLQDVKVSISFFLKIPRTRLELVAIFFGVQCKE